MLTQAQQNEVEACLMFVLHAFGIDPASGGLVWGKMQKAFAGEFDNNLNLKEFRELVLARRGDNQNAPQIIL